MRKIKLLSIMLCGTMLLTGCGDTETNSSEVEVTTASSVTSETLEPTSSEISSAEASSVATTTAEPVESGPEIVDAEFEDLLYSAETGTKINVMNTLSFELPLSVAEGLKTADEMQARITEFVTINTKGEELTYETWHNAFQGGGYFAAYPDMGMLMSEDMIVQIGVYPADEKTKYYFQEFRDSEDGSILSVAFGDIPVGALYGSTGFEMMQPAGVIEEDGNILLSYIFAAPSGRFTLTDGYYGYFIIGYSESENEYFTLLIAGINDITDPALIQAAFDGVQQYDSKATYWADFHAVTVNTSETEEE